MYDFKPPYYGAAYYPEAWPREEIDGGFDQVLEMKLYQCIFAKETK